MRHLPLPTPLIWQYYFLAAICGLFAPFWTISSTTAFLLLLFLNKPLHLPCRIFFILAIFLAFYFFSWTNFKQVKLPDLPEWANRSQSPVRICGEILNVYGLPDYRLRIILKDIYPENEPDNKKLKGLCSWIWEKAPLINPLPGQTICLKKPLRHFTGFSNNMDGAANLQNPKIYWRIWSNENSGNPVIKGKPFWWESLRQNIFLKFISSFKNDINQDKSILSQSQAIIVALLFGDRRFLSQKTVQLFSDASLAHSLALSGQHLGIAAFIALMLAGAWGRLKPNIYLSQPRHILAGLTTLPLAFLYLWLGNAPASLLRAAGMLFFFVFLAWKRSIYTLSDLLFLALLAILVLNPSAIFDTGLQMSALCLAIICLASPVMGKIRLISVSLSKNKFLYRCVQILFISFFIQLVLLPLSLIRFQQTGLWFPLNLIWLPLLAIPVLPFGAAGLIFSIIPVAFFQSFATIILQLSCLPCDLVLSLLEYIEKKELFNLPVFLSPHWTIFPAFALICLTCAKALASGRQKIDSSGKKMLIIAILFLAIAPGSRIINYFNDAISIEALDVGQGQSILINFPKNGKMLVDGGGSKSTRFDPGKNIISPILTDNRAPALATIVNTHPDLDHLGGLIYLANKFTPELLFHNGQKANSTLGEIWDKTLQTCDNRVLFAGNKLVLGDPSLGLELEVLHPPASEETQQWKGNSASIVLRLTQNGDGLALFTGDAEKSTLKHLVETGANLQAKVLFAPHHGSDRSLYAPFYNRVCPDLVIVCCGFENRWNYPGKKLTRLLKIKKIPILDTGNAGRIQIQFNNDITARTAKKGDFIFDSGDKKR